MISRAFSSCPSHCQFISSPAHPIWVLLVDSHLIQCQEQTLEYSQEVIRIWALWRRKPHECIYIDKTFEPSWSYEASFLPPSQRCPPIESRYCHGKVPKMISFYAPCGFSRGLKTSPEKSCRYLKFDRDSFLATLKPEEVGPQQWRCQSYPPLHWHVYYHRCQNIFRMYREDTDTNLQCTTIGSVLALIISLKNRTNLNMKIQLNS